ncbi:hypothetical protein ACIHAA_19425 [Streptomyces sp. NPDC052040]|uniref:hypothetical protein n=1 Tax=unclassified Streptomyces TaxID=2593676 RepID=UPI0037D5E4A5
MPASERDKAPPRVAAATAGVSMRDLLASCAAARAVSTPPRAPAPQAPQAPSGTATAAGEERPRAARAA